MATNSDMPALETLTDDNFETTLQNSEKPVLIDFSATWCQPCKSLAPKIEKVANEFEGQLQVFTVDIEEAQTSVNQFSIQGVPTCVFFKDGREVDRIQGDQDINTLRDRVNKII
jgi:thioredoxin 1